MTIDMMEARQDLKKEAEERFPEDEYTLFVTEWCDGDWQVEARHAYAESDGGNSVQKALIATPFDRRLEIREITSSKTWNALHTEEL